MSVPYRSPWEDLWYQTPFGQSLMANDPAAQISQGLAGATRSGTLAGNIPRAQDTEFRNAPSPMVGQAGDWGVWNGSVPQRPPLTSGPDGSASHQPASAGVAGTIAGGLANPRGYKASGWNLSQNQYQYVIPAEFRANQNLYQLGYDPSADTLRLPTASGGESNFNRVYAQMNSLSQQNGFGDISQAPPEFQQWAMGAAIGRLRTDYAKTGQDWSKSGFAGYDRYLAGNGAGSSTPGSTPLGNPQQPRPTTGGEFTPGTRYGLPPGYLPEPKTYDPNGATRRDLPPVQNGLTIASGGSNTDWPTNYSPSGGSGSGPAANGGGRIGPAAAKAIAQDPQLMAQQLRLMNGQTTRNKSKYADFKNSLFGQAAAALLNLETTDNPGTTLDNAEDILARFNAAAKGGGLFSLLKESGANAAGRIDMSRYDDPEAEKLAKLISGAAGLGMSSIGAAGLQSQLDDVLYEQGNYDLQDDFDGTNPLGARLPNTPYWETVKRLLGAR